uniref:Uncharacterized protein n=1 Tax=Hyaloperonospora arabidopsidis (strain Emoy2) TaxID=559515 RepID=M4BS16_HYAAE
MLSMLYIISLYSDIYVILIIFLQDIHSIRGYRHNPAPFPGCTHVTSQLKIIHRGFLITAASLFLNDLLSIVERNIIT